MKKIIFVLIGILFFSCNEKKQTIDSGYNEVIKFNVINLRTRQWRASAKTLLSIYPHEKELTINILFSNILPEEKVLSGKQMRNEPILWVLLLIKENYGLELDSKKKLILIDLSEKTKEGGNVKEYISKLIK